VVSVGQVGQERQIQDVAAGVISETSTDAVNGSQLWATNQSVENLFTELKAMTGNATGTGSASGGSGATASGTNSSAFGLDALSSGVDSSAVGANAAATGNESTASGSKALASADNATATGANSIASGTSSTALGAGSSASGNNSTALGANSSATAPNSVALGAGSVANEENTVSVGSPGNERRITNVAPGINPTDAVNVQQLQSVQQGINSVARRAYSGVAGAVALSMIPDVDAGKTLAVGIGTGNFEGYSAAALGVTARIGRDIKVRAGASTSSAGTAWGAGASYQW
jgi:autotransporter adhesin